MATKNNFRFKTLGNPISKSEADDLTNDFKTNIYSDEAESSLTPKTKNYSIAIPKKVWLELSSQVFFNQNDFEQNDGVMIDFGYDVNSKELALIFHAFSTLKNADNNDLVKDENDITVLLIDEVQSEDNLRYSTRKGGGASEGGGTASVQIPPPPRVQVVEDPQ